MVPGMGSTVAQCIMLQPHCTAINWQHVQGGTLPLPYYSSNRLQQALMTVSHCIEDVLMVHGIFDFVFPSQSNRTQLVCSARARHWVQVGMELFGVGPKPLKILTVTQQIGTLNLLLTISRAKQHFLNHILNILTFLKAPQKAATKRFENK